MMNPTLSHHPGHPGGSQEGPRRVQGAPVHFVHPQEKPNSQRVNIYIYIISFNFPSLLVNPLLDHEKSPLNHDKITIFIVVKLP